MQEAKTESMEVARKRGDSGEGSAGVYGEVRTSASEGTALEDVRAFERSSDGSSKQARSSTLSHSRTDRGKLGIISQGKYEAINIPPAEKHEDLKHTQSSVVEEMVVDAPPLALRSISSPMAVERAIEALDLELAADSHQAHHPPTQPDERSSLPDGSSLLRAPSAPTLHTALSAELPPSHLTFSSYVTSGGASEGSASVADNTRESGPAESQVRYQQAPFAHWPESVVEKVHLANTNQFQWIFLEYDSVYEPSCIFHLELQWILCSAYVVDDFLSRVNRKAKQLGFSVVQSPHSPLAGRHPSFCPPVHIPFEASAETKEELLHRLQFILDKRKAGDRDFVHISGVSFIRIVPTGFLWTWNYVYNYSIVHATAKKQLQQLQRVCKQHMASASVGPLPIAQFYSYPTTTRHATGEAFFDDGCPYDMHDLLDVFSG